MRAGRAAEDSQARWRVAAGVVLEAGAIAAAIVAAIVVGQRLPSTALAVVIGVAAGLLASVPVSAVTAWFAARLARLPHQTVVYPAPAAPAAPEPHIVVAAWSPPGRPSAAQPRADWSGALESEVWEAVAWESPKFARAEQVALVPARRFRFVDGADEVSVVRERVGPR